MYCLVNSRLSVNYRKQLNSFYLVRPPEYKSDGQPKAKNLPRICGNRMAHIPM